MNETINIVKPKAKKFRIYIKESTLDDRSTITTNCITILDYKHKLNCSKLKNKILKSLK